MAYAGIIVADPGFMAEMGHHDAPDQPRSPELPRSSRRPDRISPVIAEIRAYEEDLGNSGVPKFPHTPNLPR
jgi:hypothetical protein